MPLDPNLVITVGDMDPVPQPPSGVGTGYDPIARGFSLGLVYGDAATPFPDALLIDTSEMADRVRERQKAKASIVDLCDAAGLQPLNQASTNYCWANGPTYACEALRVVQNEPLVYLSPASVAAPIKNYRNVGGWGKEALEYMIEHGIAPVSLWPANAIDRKYDSQESRTARKQYVPVEWWELEPKNLQQLFSCLLHNIPVAVGYNWWSHEVCAVDLTTDLDLIIRNSWGDWGDRGYGKLSGNRRRPDDAVAPRTMVSG